MTVGMNHAVDEIGVFEGCGGFVVHGVGKFPGGRPGLPHILTERLAIFGESDFAVFGVEIPLIPGPCNAFRRSTSVARREYVLDTIAAYQESVGNAIGIEGCGDGGRARLP